MSYWLSSRSWARRARASMRKCLSHFGQTLRLSSRSFFQIIWRQLSHFTHKPSVRTFFSPEVSSSPASRLNQAIKAVLSSQFSVSGAGRLLRTENRELKLVLYPSLCHHALLVR